jgi:hypothetical protein
LNCDLNKRKKARRFKPGFVLSKGSLGDFYLFKVLAYFFEILFKFIAALEVHPEFRRSAEVLRKPPSWPAPGSEDTELGVFMGPEVSHGETKVYAGVQA